MKSWKELIYLEFCETNKENDCSLAYKWKSAYLLWLLCQAEQGSRSASIISFTVQLGDVLSSDGHFPCLTQTMKWVADSIQDCFDTAGSQQHFL